MDVKENLLRAIRRDHPAWVPNDLQSVITLMPPIVERPALAGLDCFGVQWSYSAEAEGGTFPTHHAQPISDLAHWREQIQFPDVAMLDWSGISAQVAQIDRRRHLVQGFVEMGLFERSYLLLGMEEALMAYLTDTDLMFDLLGALADYKIALIERFHAAAHLDMLWYGDDWGTQAQLFLPPAIWRRTIMPHTQRIYDCLKSHDILINQHSCGRIESVFGDVVAMGADMWNPCQPCNDLAALKQRYGEQIAFCGGIDSQFVLGRPGVTPADVRVEVRKRITEMALGGGYIAAPSHSVPYDPALLAAMNDEIDTFGHSFYA